MTCQTDDCELTHCKNCGCHTVGNTLIGGYCQTCWDLQDQWLAEQAQEYFRQQMKDAYPRNPQVFAWYQQKP
jgi:hypothetical protein